MTQTMTGAEACWSVLPDGLTEWVELQGKRQELADAVRGEIMVKLNLVESEELATRMENSAKITVAWATHRSTAMTALGMLVAREEPTRRLARRTVLAVGFALEEMCRRLGDQRVRVMMTLWG